MLRIVTLTTLYPNAAQPGLGSFVEAQTRRLAGLGDVDLRVIAPIGVPPVAFGRYRPLAALPAREAWNGVTVLRPRFALLPGLGVRTNPQAIVRACLPAFDTLRREGFAPQVIDAEFFFPCGVAAAELARRLALPLLIKARGSDIHHWGRHPVAAPQIVAAARRADRMLAVSAALRADMIALGMDGQRIDVHYTGVDLERFAIADRAAARAALGVDGPVVAAIGNLIGLKGHRLLLDALPLLPGANLVIAGDGPERMALEIRARELGIDKWVRLLGRLPPERIATLLNAADVLAHPSLREGLANSWVEALACGTPVVTSDIGSAREVIVTPAAGRVVARTPEAFAAAIADLLANPPLREVTRAAALPFTWERNTMALHAALTAIAA